MINPKKIFSKKKNINHLPKKFIKKIFYINEGIKNLTKQKYQLVNKKSENKISCILFTSGTTGPPKGVIVSEKMLVASAFSAGIASDVKHNDRFLLWESLHHIGGLEIILLSLLNDIEIFLLKKIFS